MNLQNDVKILFQNSKKYLLAFIKWLLLGVILGICCGVLGTFFEKSISFVTSLRAQNQWLLFLLPIGGLFSVCIYKLCKVTDIGTNQVFESIRSENSVPFLLSPAIFLGSVITHFFGGSAGREGAALQLGGSISSILSRSFRLNNTSRHILTISGMGAFFSALFGTPLGACVFALEVINIGHICSSAFLPAIVSSITAYWVSFKLGVSSEKFTINLMPDFSMNVIWRVVIIGALTAVLSVFFCFAMHTVHNFFKKHLKNEYIRILIGSFIVIILTVLLRTTDYNGSGMEVIHRIFSGGKINNAAFILKIVFTAITIAVGFKGGEIIPTLFIGAAFGYFISSFIGLSAVFGAAVRMAAMFCGVTNCPLATIILFAEMFGIEGLIYYALSAVISYFVSGYSSLYSGQKIIFSKFTEEEINIFPKD